MHRIASFMNKVLSALPKAPELIRPSAKFAFAGKEPGSTERKTGVNTPVNEDLRPALTPLFSAQVEFPRGSIESQRPLGAGTLSSTPLRDIKEKKTPNPEIDDDLDLARTIAMGAKTFAEMTKAASSGYDSP
jgi:hypothetical protein